MMPVVEANFCAEGAYAIVTRVLKGEISMRTLFEPSRTICTNVGHKRSCLALYHHHECELPGEVVCTYLDALEETHGRNVPLISELIRCLPEGNAASLFFRSTWRFHPVASLVCPTLAKSASCATLLLMAPAMTREQVAQLTREPANAAEDAAWCCLMAYQQWLRHGFTEVNPHQNSWTRVVKETCRTGFRTHGIPLEIQFIIFSFLKL